MPVWQSSAEFDENNNTSSMDKNRRSSLSISALLNDVSIDPMKRPSAPTTTNLPWNSYYSPNSSGSSSPNDSWDSFSRQPSISEPTDFCTHSRTGMRQTNHNVISVSSLAKGKRKRILPYQYNKLMETFEKTDTPSSEIRGQLADDLEMTKREVQVWFQNRRAKVSRSRVNSQSAISQQDKTSRHQGFTSSFISSSLSSNIKTSFRRASEYSHPYTKQIVPRNSFSIETKYNFIHDGNNDTNKTNQPALTMVLQAPYHPPQSPTMKSAIDILASVAEMVRS